MTKLHEKIYIVSMSMNTSVQGRPSLLQCTTFQITSLLEKVLDSPLYFYFVFEKV